MTTLSIAVSVAVVILIIYNQLKKDSLFAYVGKLLLNVDFSLLWTAGFLRKSCESSFKVIPTSFSISRFTIKILLNKSGQVENVPCILYQPQRSKGLTYRKEGLDVRG